MVMENIVANGLLFHKICFSCPPNVIPVLYVLVVLSHCSEAADVAGKRCGVVRSSGG